MIVICPHCHNDVVIVMTTKECVSVETASDSVQIYGKNSVNGEKNARSNGDNARFIPSEGGPGGVPGLALSPSDPYQQSGSGARAIRRGRKDATDYPLGFLALWALAKAQGKAGNKYPAFKAYLKLNADAELNALILTRFEEWTHADAWKRGFNQHLSTWLNQRGWEEPPTPADLRGAETKNARPSANGSVSRAPGKVVESLPPPLRCSTHEQNTRWTNKTPVDWCPSCREQKARNGTRSGEPSSMDDIMPAWIEGKT